jgi:hypothetical protein
MSRILLATFQIAEPLDSFCHKASGKTRPRNFGLAVAGARRTDLLAPAAQGQSRRSLARAGTAGGCLPSRCLGSGSVETRTPAGPSCSQSATGLRLWSVSRLSPNRRSAQPRRRSCGPPCMRSSACHPASRTASTRSSKAWPGTRLGASSLCARAARSFWSWLLTRK